MKTSKMTSLWRLLPDPEPEADIIGRQQENFGVYGRVKKYNHKSKRIEMKIERDQKSRT